MFVIKWLANAIEIEKNKNVPSPEIYIPYHDLAALLKFQTRKYHAETCFGHVECVYKKKTNEGEWFGVSVYVDPAGNVLKWGKSFIDCVKWWESVFLSQPKLMGYVEAGWKIYEIKDNLPKNPHDVWE